MTKNSRSYGSLCKHYADTEKAFGSFIDFRRLTYFKAIRNTPSGRRGREIHCKLIKSIKVFRFFTLIIKTGYVNISKVKPV